METKQVSCHGSKIRQALRGLPLEMQKEAADDYANSVIPRLEAHKAFPEFGPLRHLFGSLTDQETVIIALADAMCGVDNNCNEAGKYLSDLWAQTEIDSRQKSMAMINTHKDPEIRSLAILAETLNGMKG